MFQRRSALKIETQRLTLRLPEVQDYGSWTELVHLSEDFLRPWEPQRGPDYFTRQAFKDRVGWANRGLSQGRTVSLFLTKRADLQLVGGLTLSNIRKGPAQTATTGYWIGAPHARQGYMREALQAVLHYAFNQLDLSRLEAACLPENKPSRALLEQVGYKYEGVAQSYLQIAGRWRTHVLYANLRNDRRGAAGDAVG